MRTWRNIEVYHNKAFSGITSGTETFSLPRTHMIGDLWLVIRATNATGGNICDAVAFESIEHGVDKIQIKSGSKTFKSFNGEQCRLLAAHHDGMNPPETRDTTTALVEESVFPIHFGIEPQDEDVILPAPLLDSLDMVIEYSWPATCASAGQGGFTGTAYFDLYANVLEPTADLEDKMILIQEVKQDVTFTTSGTTPYDLTLDERRLLRKIYVEAYVTEQPEGAVCTAVEVKADNEQVMKADWEQIQFQNAVDHKLHWQQDMIHESSGTDDVYLSRIPDMYALVNQTTVTDTGTMVNTLATGDKLTIESGTNGAMAFLRLNSPVLPTMAVVDFDRDNSLRRLQPQGIRDLDILLTHGAASSSGAIIEESLQKIW